MFSLGLDGSHFRILGQIPNEWPFPSATIAADLTVVGSTIVGTTENGGTGDPNGDGTIFSGNLDGTDFQVLHLFAGGTADGRNPVGGVTLSGSKLIGTTSSGGAANDGTIYSLNLDGSDYQVVRSFTGTADDGKNPDGKLLLVGSTLYGTTQNGGANGNGEVYSLAADGSNFQTVYSFDAWANPVAGLTLVGSTLYGVAPNGGAVDDGFVYAITGALPAGPQVTGLLVDGTSWSPVALNSLAAAGLGNGDGYEIPVGSAASSRTCRGIT